MTDRRVAAVDELRTALEQMFESSFADDDLLAGVTVLDSLMLAEVILAVDELEDLTGSIAAGFAVVDAQSGAPPMAKFEGPARCCRPGAPSSPLMD